MSLTDGCSHTIETGSCNRAVFWDITGANVLYPCSLLFSSFWRTRRAPSKVCLFSFLTAKQLLSSWTESTVFFNQPPPCCWTTPVCEGCIVLRWITAHLSPLCVCLSPLCKVMASPPVAYTWAKPISCQFEAEWAHLIIHTFHKWILSLKNKWDEWMTFKVNAGLCFYCTIQNSGRC